MWVGGGGVPNESAKQVISILARAVGFPEDEMSEADEHENEDLSSFREFVTEWRAQLVRDVRCRLSR